MKRGIPVMFVFLLSLCFIGCPARELPDKGIVILSPKANDVVKTGSSYEIQWKTEAPKSEFGAMVTVELSTDGKSWEMIEDNIPDAGRYAWSVPKKESPQCRVRVFSQRKPEYRGTSGVFSVR